MDEFGSDALRYYLLAHQHSTKDGDFSRAALRAARDTELADQLGNLLGRVVALVERHCAGVVPEARGEPAAELAAAASAARRRLERAFDRFALHDATRAVWELVAVGNRYVDRAAPWALAKQIATSRDEGERAAAEQRLGRILSDLVELLRVIAVLASPFIPRAAERIARRLGVAPPGRGAFRSDADFRETRPLAHVRKGGALFPKS